MFLHVIQMPFFFFFSLMTLGHIAKVPPGFTGVAEQVLSFRPLLEGAEI